MFQTATQKHNKVYYYFCLPFAGILFTGEGCGLLIALAFHMWIFNESLMNNSEKQAVVFECKWKWKKPRIRQTLTAHILSTQTFRKPCLTFHLCMCQISWGMHTGDSPHGTTDNTCSHHVLLQQPFLLLNPHKIFRVVVYFFYFLFFLSCFHFFLSQCTLWVKRVK